MKKTITIEPYCGKYDEEIISLILGIQNGENKLGLTLEEQPDLKAIKESYSDKGGEFWTALDDGQLIGTIGLMMKPDGYAVLKKFFVHKDHRLQKVGLKLYLTLLDFAKSHGVKHIFLDTPAAARQSHVFYEKAGFRRIDISELPIEYSYPDRDSAIYILDI